MIANGVLLSVLLTVLTMQPAFAADANAGAALVSANGCAGCHGATFRGGIGPALYGIEHRRTSAQITAAIVHPVAPMPKFDLNSGQVANVVAFITTLDGAGTRPVATLQPARPGKSAMLSVRFPGPMPKRVRAIPSMQMGGTMYGPTVELKPTKDSHLWQGRVQFSMGGPWTIDVVYDGKHLKIPVNVGGSM